uniref:PorP/SprF family type IX secretion system membrane protein n=1 Tax=Emticicia sp. TaxID=1930953 RepID=UPI003BA4BA18
ALSVSYQTFAQQEAMFSQYMFNTLAINPAYAGSRDVLSLTALGRYQWVGVEGAPKTFTFSMDTPIKNEKMGIGLQVTRDEVGLQKNTGVYATYSYRIKVGPRSTLSFGVQGGATNVRWALSDAQNLTDGTDNVFLGAGDQNKNLPNFGGGIYLSNDKGYIGVSCPQIMQNIITNYNVGGSTGAVGRTRRHYFAMMGFVIGKGSFKIKPSTMVRYTQGVPLGVDGNLNFWIKDKIAFGVSGRSSQFQAMGQDTKNLFDAAIGMMELQLTPQFKLGYAYDFTSNKLNDQSKSGVTRFLGIPTHEVLIRYEFGFGKNKILTPRYF